MATPGSAAAQDEIELDAEVLETAAMLARATREAVSDLPFGAEPMAFLVVLDACAEPGEPQ